MYMGAPKGNQYAAGNPNSGRPLLYTDEELEQMAKELIEWAKTSEAKIYRKWLAERGIYPSVCKDLRERSKVFSNAIDYAKYLIGCRREELAIEGIMPEGIWSKTNAVYDIDIREWELEKKRADIDSKATTFIVHNAGEGMRKD